MEHECAELRAAPDLKTELFYSLSLSVKLAVAARGVAVNKSVNDLYDVMQAEEWPVHEWPSRIMDFFGSNSIFQSPVKARPPPKRAQV